MIAIILYNGTRRRRPIINTTRRRPIGSWRSFDSPYRWGYSLNPETVKETASQVEKRPRHATNANGINKFMKAAICRRNLLMNSYIRTCEAFKHYGIVNTLLCVVFLVKMTQTSTFIDIDEFAKISIVLIAKFLNDTCLGQII